MIDLTKRTLPNTINVGGVLFSINTDFRVWMKFEISTKGIHKGDRLDVRYLFKNDYPYNFDICELFSFSRPKNILPRPIKSSDVIPLDYEIDSDLIYSAFMGQYGIDLVEVEELHWHKFLALLNGLNDSQKLSEVIGYRCYEKPNGKEDIYEKLKYAWEIEPPLTEEQQAELEAFSKEFGG